LYAPMNGIVSKLSVALGEKVVGTAQMAGTQLITIANLNQMELQVDVSENDVLRISLGDTANIEVDAYLGRKFKGVVSHIAYSSNALADQQITKFQVKIALLPESYKELINRESGHAYPFRPGMSATADIITQKKFGVVAVPIQSVTLREKDGDFAEKKQVVYIADGDVAKEYEVETGIQDDKFIEIISGVEVGQQIINAPFRAISKELKDGKKISLVSEEELFGKE
jgi:HlyD family secretion protein